MTAILYYSVILPISLMPMSVLYRLSDLLFFIFHYLVPYRKTVVLTNLRNSFPEKSEAEIQEICKKYYRHFCDLIVESLKSFTISNEEILRRMVLVRPEVFDRYYREGRNVVLTGAHYNNWEWSAVAMAQQMPHAPVAVYKPLSNRFLDEKARFTRSKYGLRMIPMKEVPQLFSEPMARPTAPGFIMDQSPGNPAKAHWMTFLNQDTAVQFGAEKYAREFDLPVFYGVIRKVERGHYTLEFTEVTGKPRELPHGAIVETVTRMIEKDVCAAPEYWLWSHRRWKHQRPKDARSGGQ